MLSLKCLDSANDKRCFNPENFLLISTITSHFPRGFKVESRSPLILAFFEGTSSGGKAFVLREGANFLDKTTHRKKRGHRTHVKNLNVRGPKLAKVGGRGFFPLLLHL